MAGLTHVFGHFTLAAETPAAYSIQSFDAFAAMAQPLTQELPHAIMNIIAADPTSSIAVKYRNYIKTVLLPPCQRVTCILRAHSAVIEVWCHSHICNRRNSMVAAVVSSHRRCFDCSGHRSSGSLKR